MAGAALGLLAGATAFALARTPGAAGALAAHSTVSGTRVTTSTFLETTTSTFLETTTTEPVTTTTRPSPETLIIQGVGDVNFDPDYIPAFDEVGYEAAFAGIDGIFLDDSLTVINLECPPTDAGTQLDKQFSFRCDPAALPVAREHGVDVANLANNHSRDRGPDGLLDGRNNTRAAGIEPVGVGADRTEAYAPALLDVDGWTVAVLGMGGVVPGDGWLATDDTPGMASGDDTEMMVAAVEAAEAVADVVVVSIHWGRELEKEPDPDDRTRAEAMIAAGADVIFGHHPHRLGAVEVVDGVPVFWTLGNFIWPRLSDAGATTAIGRVVITPAGDVTACLIPAFIEESGRPRLTGAPPC